MLLLPKIINRRLNIPLPPPSTFMSHGPTLINLVRFSGYFPSYFNPHGLGAPPGAPHTPVLDPALSSWSANPHLAAAAMAAAAAEQLRNSTAAASAVPPPPNPNHSGFHHPFFPPTSFGSSLGGSHHIATSVASRLLTEEKSADRRPPLPIISKPNVSASPSISSWTNRISDTATSKCNTG